MSLDYAGDRKYLQPKIGLAFGRRLVDATDAHT